MDRTDSALSISPPELSDAANPQEWVGRYGDYLFRYANSRLRQKDAAEEVVQETFVAALRALDQFSRNKGAERAWLLGILKRKIIDFVRRRNRTASYDALPSDSGIEEALFDAGGHWREDQRTFNASASSRMERKEFWQAVETCIGGLPRQQADVFMLRELEELAPDEVCRELGLSRSNLWVLLHRARLALLHCLKSKL